MARKIARLENSRDQPLLSASYDRSESIELLLQSLTVTLIIDLSCLK
jgi:hypothetical protein